MSAEGEGRLFHAIVTRAGLDSLPDPVPLIGGTLDADTLAVLAGPWGTGKTFLAIDWACCVATGTPWQGRPVKAGRVLYIATEGVHGLRSRVRGMGRRARGEGAEAGLPAVRR
jgi:RecA-family ATPase